jgi:hypothetical protein
VDKGLLSVAAFFAAVALAAVLIRRRYGNLAKRFRAFLDRAVGPAWAPRLIAAVYGATALLWAALFLFAAKEERGGWDEIAGWFKNVAGGRGNP